MLKNTEFAYGRIAKFFHWTIAILIISLLAVGLYMTDLPREEKGTIYGIHKSTGILVLTLMTMRLAWRMRNIEPALPAAMGKLLKLGARISHISLYIFGFLMPLSGWGMSSAGGHPVTFYGLFTLPPLVAPNKELGGLFHDLHSIAGYALIGLIAVHAAAALWHHFIRKDDVLRKML